MLTVAGSCGACLDAVEGVPGTGVSPGSGGGKIATEKSRPRMKFKGVTETARTFLLDHP